MGSVCLLLCYGQVEGPGRVDPECEAVCRAAWLLGFLLPQAGEAWAVLGSQKWCAQAVHGSAKSSEGWGVSSARVSAPVRRGRELQLAPLSRAGGHGWVYVLEGEVLM